MCSSPTWSTIIKLVIRDEFREDLFLKYINEIHKTSCYGSSALHFAANGSNIEIILFLIRNGIDVNIRNFYGETPLHWAIKNSTIEIIQLLINNGGNIDICDSDGNSPLHWAVESEHIEAIELLLKNNAKIQKNNDNEIPLNLTIYSELNNKINDIFKKYNKN